MRSFEVVRDSRKSGENRSLLQFLFKNSNLKHLIFFLPLMLKMAVQGFDILDKILSMKFFSIQ